MSEDAATHEKWALFEAEAAYADSIFRSAIGDTKGCIRALERAVENKPDYAPAILSLGSVEYQRKRKVKGLKLLLSLVAMPDAPDHAQIIDAAGDFLIKAGEYADGLELYRAAARRYPDVGAFHQGRGCCAGHCDELEEAVAAARRALELEPNNQKFVNDLGWSLLESGALQEARAMLERAVVSGDGCERELELRATRPAQSQAPKSQNALQVREQHLGTFPVPARPLTPRSWRVRGRHRGRLHRCCAGSCE